MREQLSEIELEERHLLIGKMAFIVLLGISIVIAYIASNDLNNIME